MLDAALSAKIVSCLQSHFPLDAVYLYGSRAHGKTHADSDYDLAILCPFDALPSWEKRLEAISALEGILAADVDLLLLNGAGPIIAIQAVSKGDLLFEGHKRRHHEFVTHLYSAYAEFKELRAPMEKNILKRKFYDR